MLAHDMPSLGAERRQIHTSAIRPGIDATPPARLRITRHAAAAFRPEQLPRHYCRAGATLARGFGFHSLHEKKASPRHDVIFASAVTAISHQTVNRAAASHAAQPGHLLGRHDGPPRLAPSCSSARYDIAGLR